jgi:hypothetical protein
VLSLVKHVSMLKEVLIHTLLLSFLHKRGRVLVRLMTMMVLVRMMVLPHGCPGVQDQECSY